MGRKYVRLYPPSATPAMYPHAEGMHTNSGRVDVDCPDPQRFPLFGEAAFQGEQLAAWRRRVGGGGGGERMGWERAWGRRRDEQNSWFSNHAGFKASEMARRGEKICLGPPTPLPTRLADCVLEAGQMLFIPAGWWHYVKSTTVSFSVSYWWR